ncbi:XrtA-associated tyrosine autokinase [Catenovulum agarivorans]|uniref:XrtA-associated tyrosine autokinase n=1 Tax=Catenovulum agarivorans TaxID=1172192 RepID=UPI0002EEC6EB|nr:XrtA-associated tyrosine autokinase [Catenovulum agarivorans]
MSTIEKALAKQKEKQQAQNLQGKSPTERVQDNTSVAMSATAVEPPPQIQASETTKDDMDGKHFGEELVLPLESLDQDGYVSLSSKRKLINEELRAIKRKVLANAFGPLSNTLDAANLVAITSTSPQEGKSFTSINLALSIALEQDKTVLLVDADVLKPSVSKKLGVQDKVEQGLMDYLLGEVDDVRDIIYRTNIENLRFIPAGKSSHLSTELLASERMAQLAHEFVSRYPDRVVVMDAPPLLGINETVVLANLAGQVLVVVEEESTKIQGLKQAIEQLDKDKAIGFVVNKTKKNTGITGYGYAYAYANHE